MPAGRAIVQIARTASRNKALVGIAAPVATAAAKTGGEAYASWKDRRADRELAIRLARQIQGRYSPDTVIGGTVHNVVWKDGRPVEAFPPVPQLADRLELRDFDPALMLEPPPLKQGRLKRR